MKKRVLTLYGVLFDLQIRQGPQAPPKGVGA